MITAGTNIQFSSGTGTISAASPDSAAIDTGITDPAFQPVVSVTPYGEPNINCWLDTTLQHDGGKWTFIVKRSFGSYGGDPVVFMWKVIALNPVKEIGTTVIPVSE